jgi:hypothetical protein
MDASLIVYLFGGVFLANGVPHFVNGISGRAFQTPFSKPPGKGYSSSYVNVVWGLLNWVIAYFLLLKVAAFDIENYCHFGAFLTGALLTGLILAKAFGDIHAGISPP